MSRFVLADAHALNAAHPDTFALPSPEEMAMLIPGNLAKLGFNPAEGVDAMPERMWVLITAADPLTGYTGTLSSHPVSMPMRHGDEVRFAAKNVLDVAPAEALR